MDRGETILTTNREEAGSAAKQVDQAVEAAVPRALFLLSRLCLCAFLLVTSAYCLLAYIPFTYQWVIKCTLVKWLPVFVSVHPFLYWAVMALVALTLAPDLRNARTRRLSIGFIAVHAVAGVVLLFHPLLSNLSNDDQSFCWSLISLFPLLWIAAIDFTAHGREREWGQADGGHLTFSTATLAAIFLSMLYADVFYLQISSAGGVHLRSSEALVVVSWSLASHLLVFTLAFIVLRSIRIIAGRFASASKIEFWICSFLIALTLSLLVRKTILSALTFNNRLADVFSVVVSFCLITLMCGLSLRLRRASEANITDGFGPTLAPLVLVRHGIKSRWPVRLVWIGLIALLAYAIPAAVATRDWDFLMQKLGVVTIWTATFAIFYAAPRRDRKRQYSFVGLLLIAAVSVGWYIILGSSTSLWPALLRDEQLDVGATLERYANYDLSFKLARDLLHPNLNLFPSARANPAEGEPPRDQSFYGFLEQNTNLLPSVKVAPVNIQLAGDLTRTVVQKPNIFIFVIDSLRSDYVSPYNKAVNFTPKIESFARESLVMQNAFTRYGGTALAEPSIWTGTLQLHKQYIEPFYPMNSLQKLIQAEGYESFATIDPVVRIVTKPWTDVTELDKDYLWFEYDFCRTLTELQAKMEERRDPARPMFVYAQPQNVHLVVLKDKGNPVPPGEHYPGFFAPYASQVKYMDDCFGAFVEHLKSKGLYDNSIVILTSDHGDSLGDEGRWGHSNWIFPEILRVPLIIHLPPNMLKGMVWDPKSVAFTADITPTLYYLLGHKPIEHNAIFGRPLITSTKKEQTDYLQQHYLVVSSYGPVYGVLGGDAQSLFIADAVNRKDYFFNLADDPKGARNRLTSAIQAENQRLIRDLVVSVNQFYGLGEYP